MITAVTTVQTAVNFANTSHQIYSQRILTIMLTKYGFPYRNSVYSASTAELPLPNERSESGDLLLPAGVPLIRSSF